MAHSILPFRRFSAAPRSLRWSAGTAPSPLSSPDGLPDLPITPTRTASSAQVGRGGEGGFGLGLQEARSSLMGHHVRSTKGRIPSPGSGPLLTLRRRRGTPRRTVRRARLPLDQRREGRRFVESERAITLRSIAIPAALMPAMKRE